MIFISICDFFKEVFNLFIFMCVAVLPTCMCTTFVSGFLGVQKTESSPGTRIVDGSEPLCGCWKQYNNGLSRAGKMAWCG